MFLDLLTPTLTPHPALFDLSHRPRSVLESRRPTGITFSFTKTAGSRDLSDSHFVAMESQALPQEKLAPRFCLAPPMLLVRADKVIEQVLACSMVKSPTTQVNVAGATGGRGH